MSSNKKQIIANELLDDIKKDTDRAGVWSLCNPKNLYLTEMQGKAYLELMRLKQYSSKFHDKIEILIKDNIDTLLKQFPGKSLLIIDLGPGFPSKTFPITDAMLKCGKQIEYWAVDVNEYFGNLARDSMLKRGVDCSFAKKMLFEDIPAHLKEVHSSQPRLVIIGPTFMNFDPPHILGILKKCVSRSADACVSAIECADDIDTSVLTEGYKTDVCRKFTFLPLSLLGVKEEDAAYQVDFCDNKIEMSFILRNIPEKLKQKGVQNGDKIIVAISYRHTEKQYKNLLSHCFGKNSFFKMDSTIVAFSSI